MVVAVVVVGVLAVLGWLAWRGWVARAVAAGTAVMVVLAAAGAELTDNVVDHDGVSRADPAGLSWAVAHREGLLTTLAMRISDAGGTFSMAVLAVVVAAWLAWRRRWAPALLVVVASAGAGIFVTVLKAAVGRSRPPVVYRLVTEDNQSFPSGHSLGSIVVLGVLAALVVLHARRRALRVAAVAIAALAVGVIGLSRLYLGVHWLTDVLAGWTIGAAWLALCVTVYVRFRPAPTGRTHIGVGAGRGDPEARGSW